MIVTDYDVVIVGAPVFNQLPGIIQTPIRASPVGDGGGQLRYLYQDTCISNTACSPSQLTATFLVPAP